MTDDLLLRKGEGIIKELDEIPRGKNHWMTHHYDSFSLDGRRSGGESPRFDMPWHVATLNGCKKCRERKERKTKIGESEDEGVIFTAHSSRILAV